MKFLDIFKYLKRPPIKVVYTAKTKCFVAPKGTGKSTLQAVLANEYDQDPFFKTECAKTVSKLNSLGFKSLRVPKTLVYSDTSIKLVRKGEQPFFTNDLDPFKIQFPNNIDEYVINPPYALYLIDEPYKIWGNRESATLPERVEAEFWLTRHFDLSMYLFYQDKNGVDKKLRENLNEYNFIKNMDIKYYFWRRDKDGYRKVKRVTWEIWRYFRYEDFMLGYMPPDPSVIRYARRVTRSVFNWLPPFCWFKREQRLERLEKARMLLERAEFSEIDFKVFKGDPFKLFNSKNFAYAQYKHCLEDGQVESLDDYITWAENLTYPELENPDFEPKTLENVQVLTERMRVVKPETYTKNATARKIKEARAKEKQKK